MQGSSDPNRVLLDAAVLCGHLVPAGSVYAFLAEHRERLFGDELFEDLFLSGRGRPSVPADVVATVMVLQALEGLSDRDAVGQLRTNIAWKVAAGLALDDVGFFGRRPDGGQRHGPAARGGWRRWSRGQLASV